jgi:hypothetical protein
MSGKSPNCRSAAASLTPRSPRQRHPEHPLEPTRPQSLGRGTPSQGAVPRRNPGSYGERSPTGAQGDHDHSIRRHGPLIWAGHTQTAAPTENGHGYAHQASAPRLLRCRRRSERRAGRVRRRQQPNRAAGGSAGADDLSGQRRELPPPGGMEGVSLPVGGRAPLSPLVLPQHAAGARPVPDERQQYGLRLPAAAASARRRPGRLAGPRHSERWARPRRTRPCRRPSRRAGDRTERHLSHDRRRPDDRRRGRDDPPAVELHRGDRLPARASGRAERAPRRGTPRVRAISLARRKVLAGPDFGPAGPPSHMPKPLARRGHCTASTDGEASSGPAGQDVSLELGAVHGPRLHPN